MFADLIYSNGSTLLAKYEIYGCVPGGARGTRGKYPNADTAGGRSSITITVQNNLLGRTYKKKKKVRAGRLGENKSKDTGTSTNDNDKDDHTKNKAKNRYI